MVRGGSTPLFKQSLYRELFKAVAFRMLRNSRTCPFPPSLVPSRGPDLVSKATRDKVMKAADELNFSISRSAAALKTGRALRIAVLDLAGRLNLWFSSSIIEGLNEVFHDEGYDISIYQMSSTEERSEFFNMLPVRRNVDAVIVISFDIASTAKSGNSGQSMCQSSASIRACRKSAASTPPSASTTSRVRTRRTPSDDAWPPRHRLHPFRPRSDAALVQRQGRYESFMACCQANGVEPRVLAPTLAGTGSARS